MDYLSGLFNELIKLNKTEIVRFSVDVSLTMADFYFEYPDTKIKVFAKDKRDHISKMIGSFNINEFQGKWGCRNNSITTIAMKYMASLNRDLEKEAFIQVFSEDEFKCQKKWVSGDILTKYKKDPF